jgi:hypothetical protein
MFYVPPKYNYCSVGTPAKRHAQGTQFSSLRAVHLAPRQRLQLFDAQNHRALPGRFGIGDHATKLLLVTQSPITVTPPDVSTNNFTPRGGGSTTGSRQ